MIAPGPAIRLLSCVVATLFLLLLFREGRFTAVPGVSSSSYTSLLTSSRPGGQPLKVSILETKGCHDEVSASFFTGFGQMEECEVDAFLGARRFGIESIYDQLPGSNKRSLHNKTEFVPEFFEKSRPDVVLFITSEYSMVDKKVAPTLTWLFENTNCILVAVVHHPDEWKTEAHLKAAKSWMENRRIHFITLSSHVSKYMVSTVVNTWEKRVEIKYLPRVSTFPAVFTIPSLAPKEEDGESWASPTGKVRFAMQGDLIVNRLPNRDYAGTFNRFAKLVSGNKGGDSIELRVLGNGGIPKVPEEAKDNIQFDVALPYLEFYKTLQSATALLPAFSDASYCKATKDFPSCLSSASIALLKLV
jgi:hypothetical protein